ncbi:sensor histidine kinase [Kitasatospora aureofaciens]|uniref:sensor histidine kinase n=1 Tax=Kitasatospora aureofaciens TaxID=1894 RepID=UPI001C448EB5|nr:sensor histidine kinase [Kitasatospora aureofaciens]MBV6701500.1 sensor histidine kinase [Kitasatospora aureofaciens]
MQSPAAERPTGMPAVARARGHATALGRLAVLAALVPAALGLLAMTLVGLTLWFVPLDGTADALLGLALTAAGLGVAERMLRLHGYWTRALLGPTERAGSAHRVEQVTEVPPDAPEGQAPELRRIERDLHDGAQARLLAVSLRLGAVGALIDRDPQAAKKLVTETQENVTRALQELRDLVRGVCPPVLAERGLVDAVRALALDVPLRVAVRADVPGRAESPVESAVYFAVSEALANAVKHGDARHATVEFSHTAGLLRAEVADDGHGGADPLLGSGLRGIQRRLAAFDGTLTLSSPPGGPTRLTMELPCVLSSPRTSTS